MIINHRKPLMIWNIIRISSIEKKYLNYSMKTQTAGKLKRAGLAD
jgi:hypothetical protein